MKKHTRGLLYNYKKISIFYLFKVFFSMPDISISVLLLDKSYLKEEKPKKKSDIKI